MKCTIHDAKLINLRVFIAFVIRKAFGIKNFYDSVAEIMRLVIKKTVHFLVFCRMNFYL